MDELHRLGTAVRQRRMALDLTQAEAATKAGVSDQTWLNVEAGKPKSGRWLASSERSNGRSARSTPFSLGAKRHRMTWRPYSRAKI